MTTRKRQRLERNKALKRWAATVKDRDKVCVVCGSDKLRNAHHILPKERYPELALEPINGITLCPRCHKFGKYSAHRNAIWFACWLRDNRSDQWSWATREMRRRPNENALKGR